MPRYIGFVLEDGTLLVAEATITGPANAGFFDIGTATSFEKAVEKGRKILEEQEESN